MIYLMNSAVMPAGNYGTYSYAPATLADLGDLVHGLLGPWESCLGYPQNADLVFGWTGIRPKIRRVETFFQPGDRAFVMRLKTRVKDPGTKGAAVSSSPEDWEFAWVAKW